MSKANTENAQLRADAAARAELVKQGTPLSTIAALYPVIGAIERYLSHSCNLEPYVDVVPTDDPKWWRRTAPCEATCHHPVHAFGHPERLRHLVDVPPFD